MNHTNSELKQIAEWAIKYAPVGQNKVTTLRFKNQQHVEGTSVINGHKCNKVTSVIKIGHKCNNITSVIKFGHKCNKSALNFGRCYN